MAASPAPVRRYRHYDLVLAGFVTVLLCSNLIGTAKVSEISLPFALPVVGATLIFGVGNIFFPISYIFGDVLTEVYGYARARRVIWAGFLAMLFATVMSIVVIGLPATPSEPFNATLQPALELVFGNTWRIVLASIVGFWAGDFVNAYVLARMKVWTRGRWLWTRTIGSTIVGQAVDSVIFYPIAFFGIWQGETLVRTIAFNWSFKVLVEVVLTPVTYAAVAWLKRREHEDYYDVGTNFTPFSLKD
ncbi:MAG TPA: queuosine precursor transporter [Gammaproteobacteria bacterium]|nr:queuosine precursor transporter [Gammaproteobacteria bacterium]